MPSHETRQLLKLFGIAVTEFEDAVAKGSSPEDLRRAEAEVRARLAQVNRLIERLGQGEKASRPDS